jgi:peptide deformylase
VASPAGEPDPDLAADLLDTLQVLPGALGLTAAQLGVSIRALCVDVSESPAVRQRGLPHHGPIVLFDPELVRAERYELHREGCVSVPDFTVDVRRPRRATVRGTDSEGSPRVVHAEDLEARALHHQLDHLDGWLLLDRVACVRTHPAPPSEAPTPPADEGRSPPP